MRELGIFFRFASKVRHKVRHNTKDFLDIQLENKYPFKKAKLIHHDRDLTKRWYVSCWAWNVELNKLVRKRYYGGINRYKTISERLEAGKQLKDYINEKLEAGYVVGKDLSVVNSNDLRNQTIIHAFEYVVMKKKNTVAFGSYKQYCSTVSKLNKWLKQKSMERLKIGKLDTAIIHDFLDNLFTSGSIESNKTYNNHRVILCILINYIIDRDNKIFNRNPAEAIKMLPTSSKKHAAFSANDMAVLKKEMLKQGEHQLLLFVEFIYYTLARPNEVNSLRVGDIELDADRIFIPRGISKNRKSDYVDIYPPLKKSILDSKIMEYPKEYYLFTT